MRVMLLLGFLTIFISCVFIFFTFDILILNTMTCMGEEKITCNINQLNGGVAIGFGIITAFILIDLLVLYIIFRHWSPDLFMFMEEVPHL